MKNSIQKIFLIFLLGCYGALNAQVPLTGAVQTSFLNNSSISAWTPSTSDKNKKLYAIAYWTESPNQIGNYFKIYNGATYDAVSPEVKYSNYASFSRIKLDNENNVYVLYKDWENPNGTVFKTYLKKYSASGNLIGSRIQVVNNTHPSDITIAPNGDVLIGCTENNKIKVKVYRNMGYVGSIHLDDVNNNNNPIVIHMDMKDEKLAVGYSFGPFNNSKLIIKRYTYAPNNIGSSALYAYYDDNSHFDSGTNQLALRNNWDVFFNSNISTSHPFTNRVVKFLNNNTSSVFQNSSGLVDVDLANRLIISQDYGAPVNGDFKVKLYESDNSLIHEFQIDNQIKDHLNSVAIYDCEFIVTGVDRKLGANPYRHKYQSFHQVFDCGGCKENSRPTAAAEFRFPYQENEYDSYYGPIKVTELCLIDDLLVDGSASTCEDRYFVGLSEFNLSTWTDTNVLHSAWVSPLTQAPNNINIVDFLPQGYHLKPGKIYRFRLAVGNPWDSVDIFFEVSCCKREIIADPHPGGIESQKTFEYTLTFGDEASENHDKDVNFKVFPNPAQDQVTLDFSDIESKNTKIINIRNLQGVEVYASKTQDQKETIHIKNWPTGIYISTAIIDGKSYQNKIIKK